VKKISAQGLQYEEECWEAPEAQLAKSLNDTP